MRFHLGRLSMLSRWAAYLQILTLLYLFYCIYSNGFAATPPPARGSIQLPGEEYARGAKMLHLIWEIPAVLICTAIGALNWFASRQYLQGTHYGLLKITAWVNAVPCLSANFVGWALGAYQLVVLYSDDVKKVFEHVERGRDFASAMGGGPSGTSGPGGSGRRPGLAKVAVDDDEPPLLASLLEDTETRVDLDDTEKAAARAQAAAQARRDKALTAAKVAGSVAKAQAAAASGSTSAVRTGGPGGASGSDVAGGSGKPAGAKVPAPGGGSAVRPAATSPMGSSRQPVQKVSGVQPKASGSVPKPGGGGGKKPKQP